MKKDALSKMFLLFLLVAVIAGCYIIFKPFLVEFLVAAILTSIFFRPYKWLRDRIGKKVSSLIMCFLIVLIVIIPIINLLVFSAQKSISAYQSVAEFVNNNGLKEVVGNDYLEKAENFLGISEENIKAFIVDSAKRISNILMNAATTFVTGTTNFIISLVAIVFIMFFFFLDGERMAGKLMDWLPLPKQHSQEIFKKFREVSYSTVIATFVTAIAQGAISGLGFFVVGIPVFLLSILVAFFSLIPYVGSGIVWFPVGIYLLLIGDVWEGVFILLWGAILVSFADNIIRAYLIKGKSGAHPLFIIFSILGGIALFGFWGVIIGPLIISLAMTILHIYEFEYKEVLEDREQEKEA